MTTTPQAPRQAIGYVRVSTNDQVKGHSLDHQKDIIKAWGKKYNIAIRAIIQSDGVGESGKDLQRPSIDHVNHHIMAGGIGWVVVSKVDRLSRDLEDTSILIDEWGKHGVAIIAPEDGIDDPTNRAPTMVLMRSWWAEFERNRIVSRARPGLRAHVENGLPLGRPPYGYRIEQTASDSTQATRRSQRLVPDPETAPIIQVLFEKAAAEEWGARKLATWVNDNYGTSMSHGQVAKILNNTIYIGTIRSTQLDILREHNHAPLVSTALFQAARDKRARLQKEHNGGERHVQAKSWLGGIARCGICHGPITVRLENDTYGGVYHCRTRLTSTPCGAPEWSQDQLDSYLLNAVYHKLSLDLNQLMRVVQGAIDAIPAHLDAGHEQAAALLARGDRDEQQLTSDLENGLITAAQFANGMKSIHADRAAARKLLQETNGGAFLAQLWADGAALKNRTSRMHPEVAKLLPTVQKQAHITPQENTTLLWLPLTLVIAAMSLADRRRLLKAMCHKIELPGAGNEPHVELTNGVAGYADLAHHIGRSLASGQGFVIG